MKSKISISVIVLVGIGIFFWWSSQSVSQSPPAVIKVTDTAPIVNQPSIPAPPPSASPNPASPSTMPPALPALDVAPQSTPSAVPEDPHNNLHAALMDMARIARSGDMWALTQAYTSPDELAKQDPVALQKRQALMGRMANDPNPAIQQSLHQMAENEAAGFESIKDQTPIYNAAGDEATYSYTITQASLPGLPSQPINRTLVMVKIDGRWFVKKGL